MNSENNYSTSNDNHFFNINSLVNIYKDNNEFLTNLCNNNGTNFILSEDNTMSIINQILTSNNRIYDNIINMMNNNSNNNRSNNNNNNNYNNYNVRNTYRNLRGLNRDIRNTNIDRNISFRNNRIYIDNIPYIIDNIETYSLQNNTPYSNLHNFRDFFEPVEIFPTQSQIENATRIVRYCGHIFNGNELNNWFRTNCRCPVCRYDIRNYNHSNNINNLFNEVNENNTDNTNTNSTNTNSTNNTNSTSLTENINSDITSQDNIQNNNSSINNVERSPTNNSNSNLIRQIVQNIVNEVDSNLLNQNEPNRFEQIFYTIFTDLSGNIPYNSLRF